MLVSFDSCTFTNNRLKAIGTSDGEPEAGGGGVMFQFVGKATDVDLRFMQSSFTNNSLYTENEDGTPLCHGGAVSLSYLDAAIGVRTAFTNCLFADQTLRAKTQAYAWSGGELRLEHLELQHGFSEDQQGAAIRSEGVLVAKDCVFAGNHAVGRTANGVWHFMGNLGFQRNSAFLIENHCFLQFL